MKKKKIKRPANRDRMKNPHDGSRRRNKQEHKSMKKYTRKGRYQDVDMD